MASMVIDVHAHVCAAPELYQWKSVQMSARGAHGYAPKKFSDEYVRDHADTRRNLRIMDSVGTDVQFLSPRPFQLMHAEKPLKMVESWAEANDIKPLIDAIDSLSEQDRRNIFEENARRLFSRLSIPRPQEAAQLTGR